MTIYGIDGDHELLIAMWQVGNGGGVAQTVATMPARTAVEHSQHLAVGLSALSAALWESYVRADPAGEADASIDEAQRDDDIELTDRIAGMLQRETGTANDAFIAFYDPIDEAGHRIREALCLIDSADLDVAVFAEVRREISAVEAAARGDLSGRTVKL